MGQVMTANKTDTPQNTLNMRFVALHEYSVAL